MADTKKKAKITLDDLNGVNGGQDGWVGLYDGPWKTVCNLTEGYLALRTEPSFNYSNECGCLHNGMQVQVTGNASGNGYIWVYSPDLYRSGWVNVSFIR